MSVFTRLMPLLMLSATSSLADTNGILTTVSAINRIRTSHSLEQHPFEITATVLYAHRHHRSNFTVVDDRGETAVLWDHCNNGGQIAREGRRVRLRGLLKANRSRDWLVPGCTSYEDLGTVSIPEPSPLSADTLAFWTDFSRPVIITGVLRDTFQDETDPNFIFLTIRCGSTDIYAAFSTVEDSDLTVREFLGERISLTGFVSDESFGSRIFTRRNIGKLVNTHLASIKSAEHRAMDPFEVPPIPDIQTTPAAMIKSFGRRQTSGFVIALWSGENALLQTDDGHFVSVEFSKRPNPDFGSHITVSGIPLTDTYQINLKHALWRRADITRPFIPEKAKRTSIEDIIRDKQGRRRFDRRRHGQAVTLRGRLIHHPSDLPDACRFYVEQDGDVVKVDASATPSILDGIPNDSIVDVSGTCIMELEPGISLPRVGGFFLTTRTPADIRLIERPPWWTFGKMLILLSVALSLLGGTLVWTILLKRLSNRRGNELAAERLSAVESQLKVYERTRLAVELHDLLSQMLSGISMQIGTVRKFFDSNRGKALAHLGIADKTLLACRESLRDCLWDLRNRAIEEPDMNKAIRDTLEPHTDGAALAIRFAVPRDLLTDNAAHAILSIIRELVVNAIRHGAAKTIRVAGSVENGKVLFSVTDNGIGFDPDTAPGMAQGHFGLQGIRERVEGFGGDMSVSSAIGQGAKVTIKLNLPQDNERNER